MFLSSIINNVMIDIHEIENQIINKEKTVPEGEHSLSYMLLVELKASARRWFIISVIELVIILGIVIGMLWYVSLPTEEYNATVDTQGNENNVIGIGDRYEYNGESISENSAR